MRHYSRGSGVRVGVLRQVRAPDSGSTGHRMQDLVPGKTNSVWVTLDRPGTYDGACNQ